MQQSFGSMVTAWYAAYTQAKHEKFVADALRKQAYAVFLPIDRIRSRLHRANSEAVKTRWRDVPHYPRYVFVGRREGQSESIAPINATIGVSTVVYRGEKPLIVPHKVIDALMLRADSDGYVSRLDKPLVRGQRVCLASPFDTLKALVEVDEGKRVSLLLEGFDSERRIVVPPEAIARIA